MCDFYIIYKLKNLTLKIEHVIHKKEDSRIIKSSIGIKNHFIY